MDNINDNYDNDNDAGEGLKYQERIVGTGLMFITDLWFRLSRVLYTLTGDFCFNLIYMHKTGTLQIRDTVVVFLKTTLEDGRVSVSEYHRNIPSHSLLRGLQLSYITRLQ